PPAGKAGDAPTGSYAGRSGRARPQQRGGAPADRAPDRVTSWGQVRPMPMPAYQEYPALWDQARQAAQGPIDPGFAPNTAPPGNLEAPAVDPDAVLEAARAATAHNPGGPVLGCHVFNCA